MNNKPRKPLVAGILSLIQPGLGQVYNGEIRKAILIFIIPILLIPGMILSLNSEFIRVFLVSYAVLGSALLCAGVDRFSENLTKAKQ